MNGKEDVVRIYNGILLSHKENEIMPSASTWMQLEIITISEVGQKEKDKYHVITYMWNLKYDTNEPVYETETDSRTERTDWCLPRGRGLGEGGSGRLG